jgi:phosphoserine phosphatase RsbU/P
MADRKPGIVSPAERVSEVVFRYAPQIAREQDTARLLQLIADMARDLVGADRCAIWLVDTATGEAHAVASHGFDRIRIAADQGLAGLCLRCGESYLVNDAQADPRVTRKQVFGLDYPVRSVLLVPLRGLDGSIIGAFHAMNKPGGFEPSDIDLLELAASFSANALETQRLQIENEAAQRLYREMEIARGVQEGLLPGICPKVSGLEVAAACVPARFIGGDYYDFMAMPTGSWAFTVGDVSGKGVAAAVLMASIQASLRTLLLHGTDDLPRLVGSINQYICSVSSSDRYSTLICGMFDDCRRTLRFVNAGHCEPYLIRRNGALERLLSGGMPIGLFPVARYEQATVSLEVGDLLVCFSDGISEAQNSSGEFWSKSDLEKVMRSCNGLGAQEALDRVYTAARAFENGAEPADDATLVVLRAC